MLRRLLQAVTVVTMATAALAVRAYGQETSSTTSGAGGAPAGMPVSGYEGDASSGGTFGTASRTEHTQPFTARSSSARARSSLPEVVDRQPEGSISNPFVSNPAGDPR